MNIDGVLNDLGIGVGGGSNIKSVQRGTFLWNTAETIKTITINEVDVSKSVILLSPYGTTSIGSTDYANIYTGVGEFVGSTTIEVTRQTGTSVNDLGMYWQVIEFSNVKQKQSGVAYFSSWIETDGINISEVNLEKTILFHHHRTVEATTYGSESNHIAGVFLDTPTHIQVYPLDRKYLHWQLVEFN